MDALLRASGASLTEPSLLWLLGPVPTVAGFPPWRLRLAEIHHVAPRPAALSEARMEASLRAYLRTVQRYGA